MSQINGMKTFLGVFSGKNEYSELRLQYLVQSSGHDQLKVPLSAAYSTMVDTGGPLPRYVWSDRCCDDAPFLQEVWPSLATSLAVPAILPLPDDANIKVRLTGPSESYFAL
jgi:hypothetical protein